MYLFVSVFFDNSKSTAWLHFILPKAQAHNLRNQYFWLLNYLYQILEVSINILVYV